MTIRERCQWSVVGLLLAAAAARTASGQCEGWAAGLQFPGTAGIAGTVHAITEWDPDGGGPLPSQLIAGGNFGLAGTTAANYVARWDGSAWHAMGAGFDGNVLSLAVFNNELFAGGAFGQSGPTGVARIARWDGVAWQSVGGGFNASVLAILPHNGQLYVCGNFTASPTGLPFNYVARWNGTAWMPMSLGLWGLTKAMTVYEGTIVAGGSFGVARWNGTTWQSLGDTVNFETRTLVVHDGVLIAGGAFALPSALQQPNVAQLIDGLWLPVADGFSGGEVYALASYDNTLIAGGDFQGSGSDPINRVARLMGTDWSSLGTGVEGPGVVRVQALLARESELVVGGSFTLAGGNFSFGWGRWTGDGTAPEITLQPVHVTITRGETASFTVDASSNPGLATFQWARNGEAVMNGPGGASVGGGHVTGAQMASLTITNAQYADDGSYLCVVTNECGSVESAVAVLSVPCAADFNDDGSVMVDDIFGFLTCWFAGDVTCANFNADCCINVGDIFDYLTAWFAGCS